MSNMSNMSNINTNNGLQHTTEKTKQHEPH